MPRLRIGLDRKPYLVFSDTHAAYRWYWLLGCMFRRNICCFGDYENAYSVF